MLLSQLVLQGNQSAILPPGAFPSPSTTFSSAGTHVQLVNALLYTSIALSIAAVTLGIMCLQWMDALFGKAGMTNEAFCDVREVRFEGFNKAAGPVVEALPLLLLISLISFFAGLLVYLGIDDWTVAIPVYIVLLLVSAVVIATTVWPAIAALCAILFPKRDTTFNPPFQSTQSWLFVRLSIKIARVIQKRCSKLPTSVGARVTELRRCKEWYQFDALWASWSPKRCKNSLLLPLTLATGTKANMDALYHCFNEWKDIDQHLGATGTAGGRQLSVLRYIASQKSDSPSFESTIAEWETRFIKHFVRTLNSGEPINRLGSMEVESKLSMKKAKPGTSLSFQPFPSTFAETVIALFRDDSATS